MPGLQYGKFRIEGEALPDGKPDYLRGLDR
jgi:hypothetical protein